MTTEEKKILQHVTAQLRHLYRLLHNGAVTNQKTAANGLVAPQIEALERLLNKCE